MAPVCPIPVIQDPSAICQKLPSLRALRAAQMGWFCGLAAFVVKVFIVAADLPTYQLVSIVGKFVAIMISVR